jgi:hypothetical protein
MKVIDHLVYLEPDRIVLEVIRKNQITVYSINDSFHSVLSTGSSHYSSKHKLEADPYYIDRISSSSLEIINLLTVEFDLDEIIGKMRYFKSTITPGVYKRVNFSMELSNLFEDYKDSLKQLSIQLDEEDMSKVVEEVSAFFDLHFYDRTEELSNNDFEEIQAFFKSKLFI